ncbi:ankyrin repeat domain-containing protein 11 [Nematostella vectensis]|nr:ankyrin repeat domain-containing protein 11 [Nematostella vectensis]
MEAPITLSGTRVPTTPSMVTMTTAGEREMLPQHITPEGPDSVLSLDPITPFKEGGLRKKPGKIGSKRKLFLLAGGGSAVKAKKVSTGIINKPKKTSSSAVAPPSTPKPVDGSWPVYPLTERQQLQYLLEVTAREAQKEEAESETDESAEQPSERLRQKEPEKKESNAVRVSKRNERGETALHLASIKGDVDELRSLIKAGANVNIKDYAGWTPLHEACNFGHISIVEELIKAGACVNTPGYESITPLHDAIINNHVQVVELLLYHGADPDKMTLQEYKAIDLARSASIIELLQTGKAPTNTPKLQEDTAHGSIPLRDTRDSVNNYSDTEIKKGSTETSNVHNEGTCQTNGLQKVSKDISRSPHYQNNAQSAQDCNQNELKSEKHIPFDSATDIEMADEEVDPRKLNECMDKAMIEISSYLQVTTDNSLITAPVNSVSGSQNSIETQPRVISTATVMSSSTVSDNQQKEHASNSRDLNCAEVINPNGELFEEDEVSEQVKSPSTQDKEGEKEMHKGREASGRTIITRQDRLRNKENSIPTHKSAYVKKRRSSVRISSKSDDSAVEGQECASHIRDPSWRKFIEQHRYSMHELPLNIPGYKDFLINRSVSQVPTKISEVKDMESEELSKLRTSHQVEQEKLRISFEQEVVRLFGNFARSLIRRDVPFGVCTILKHQMTMQHREVLHPAASNSMRYPSAERIRTDIAALIHKFGTLKDKLLRRQRHEFDAALALLQLTDGDSSQGCLEAQSYPKDFALIPKAFREYYEDFLCLID